MSNSDEIRNGEISDPDVSSAYRATAVEITPTRLDEKILREAARETSADAPSFRFISWLRPVTFVATAGLCVALLLPFTQTENYDSPSGMPVEMHAISPGPAADTSLTAPPSVNRESIEPAGNPAGAEPGPASAGGSISDADDFRRAASDTAGQVRAVESAADATLQEMPRDLSQEASVERKSETGFSDRRCTEEQRQDADEWWSCIRTLRATGLDTQAQIEAKDLRNTYPSYSPPP